MKKIVFTLCVVFAIATLKANPVDPATARKAATNFLHAVAGTDKQFQIIDITSVTPFNGFYVFTLNDGCGFILVAGDNTTEPILGYSLTCRFEPGNMPPHVLSWLDNYDKEIAFNRQCEPTKSVSDQWKSLLDGSFKVDSKASVDPMITTEWNQSPYYNALCPYDSANNGRAVCGCTATATAQIMKYFSHPNTGYGSCTHSHRLGELFADYGNTVYLWDSMPHHLGASSSEAQVNAVATIIYHIGVAVSMDYSALGSGGKTASYGYGGDAASENAFKYNFKYSPYVWTAFRIDYDLVGWKALMKEELNNGRPILYAGYDELQAGHAFVLDGYNNIGHFHINWGWGGSYDGFFKLNDLNPHNATQNSGYHFDLFATATIGIEPYSHFGETVTNVTTAVDGFGGTVTGSGTYNFGDTIVLTAIPENDFTKFVQWSDGCKYNPRSTVATGGDVSFTAQFAPLRGETMRYYTTDNAMNRAANIPTGLGRDSIWGIRIPESVLWNGDKLTGVRFMGYKEGTITLSIYQGTDSPTELLYTDTFRDSLDYPYTFFTYQLPSPLDIDSQKSLWIKLKCTDVDTCGVFSIWSGNPNSMLIGENLEPSDAKFSWMIQGLFDFSGTTGIDESLYGAGNARLAVYPNPANDNITIQTEGFDSEAVVRIVDLRGVVCYSSSLAAGNIVSVADLPRGVYYVIVNDSRNSSVTKVVVK